MGRRGAFRGPTVDVTLRMATEMLERIERLRPDDYSRSRWLREILRTGLMVLQDAGNCERRRRGRENP